MLFSSETICIFRSSVIVLLLRKTGYLSARPTYKDKSNELIG